MFQEYLQMSGIIGIVITILGILLLFVGVYNIIWCEISWSGFKKKLVNENGVLKSISLDYLKSYQDKNPFLCFLSSLSLQDIMSAEDFKIMAGYIFAKKFSGFQASIKFLRTIVTIAPLLGLLGTVVGMIQVFMALSENVTPDSQTLALGIWQALFTTVQGIVVAVPGFIISNWLSNRMRLFKVEGIGNSWLIYKAKFPNTQA